MHSPFTIEIVPVDRGWILETIAEAIERQAAASPERFNARVVDEPSDRAELTFFLPESAYRPLRNSITVTYLAHKEEHSGAAALFEKVARSSDYCITSSTKYQQILEKDGAKKVFKIHLGVDTALFTPKLRLGVVGRTYHTGRKGEALLAELADMPMVELRFTGEGWPYPADFYSTSDLVQFYRDIDYLLIPSLIEGGPVPLLEALSAGCPVIAPSDIGLVEDFPHIPFKCGDAQDLRRVVQQLLERKLSLRESVLDCDWTVFAQRHLDIFAELIEERRRAQPLRGPASSALAENSVRVLLVTHGTEDAAKGGPSTRVRFIVSQLQTAGHKVATCHNVHSVADLAEFDTVHVFNSWPPQTALKCMALAKSAGKVVIFSPIALDLGDWPVYRQLLECAFASGRRKAVESVIEQLPRLAPPRCYSGESADIPIEGIPGHFESLRQCCALADRIIFLSDLERDFLSALGARTDHGVLIHNGVADVFSDDADPQLFRERFGLKNYVLCVGRVEYRKNQALLAMAMRDLDVPLVLIGDVGDPGYLDHVRLIGGRNLYHYARIDDKDLLASAYAGASAFVLPSWCEGAPLAALEAGLTGVPLILSDRSSEQEYFGGHAYYVSPADPASMRSAIERVLSSDESQTDRAARAAFLRARYSETAHVQRTLDLYRKATAMDLSADEQNLVIDASSLLHSLRVGGHLTGVPLAESNLIAEIMAMRPGARCIVYNDIKGRFIQVAYRDLLSFDSDAFNRRYWFSASDLGSDWRLELSLSCATSPPQIEGTEPTGAVGSWGYWSARVAGLLGRLGLSQRLIRRIGKLAKRLRTLGTRSSLPTRAANAAPSNDADVDFSDVRRYLSRIEIPRATLNLAPGSRILSLGQGWLSNEPLLDQLIKLAAGRKLEAYIYDISYVSGAHFSGWRDNDDRQRRLTKLLRHCHTVFTESRITATELVKFGASRSMAFHVVRTGLRGKDISAIKSPILPRWEQPFVLYVSSFNRRKNHDFIVGVWKDLMSTDSPVAKLGVRLLLVGEVQGESKYGDPGYQAELRSFNVDIINGADDGRLAEYYTRCLFTVFPSLQEGWGIPIQESLMYGKVCVASDAVPAADEIENAAVIKLAPNDFFGWREAIVTWVTNDAMRLAFEVQAARYVAPSWKSIAESILNRTSLT